MQQKEISEKAFRLTNLVPVAIESIFSLRRCVPGSLSLRANKIFYRRSL